MAKSRASVFDDTPEIDLSSFTTKPRPDQKAPSLEQVRAVSEAANFPSRQASPQLLAALRQVDDTRRKVFVSYHHHQDQASYDAFSRNFCKMGYNVIQDNSLRNAHDSDDPQYIAQSIRDNNITGTSCTIVLCGAYTHGRKYVDWEIKGTLDKDHGLIGIQLPSAPVNSITNLVTVPMRLLDNINSGYAIWTGWQQLMAGPDTLKALIEDALNTTKRPKRLIVNGRDMMRRNTAG